MSPSTSSAGPTPLGQLISESVAYAKAHMQPLVAGAIVFGIVAGMLGVVFQQQVGLIVDDIGIDLERMEELGNRIEAGDEAALEEFESMLAGIDDEDVSAAMGRGAEALAKFTPRNILLSLVGMLVSLLAYAWYTLVAVEGADLGGTANKAKRAFLPLLGVYVWATIRSFAWLPFVGWIIAIVVGPRFVAAPLIHLTEQKSITQSVSESYRRTKGYWGKIVGNWIVAGLLFGLCALVAMMVLGLFLGAVPVALVFIGQIVGQISMAVFVVFSVRLSQTILQHPRA